MGEIQIANEGESYRGLFVALNVALENRINKVAASVRGKFELRCGPVLLYFSSLQEAENFKRVLAQTEIRECPILAGPQIVRRPIMRRFGLPQPPIAVPPKVYGPLDVTAFTSLQPDVSMQTLSKVMANDDYNFISPELKAVEELARFFGGWDTMQHHHRRWEYALALKTLTLWSDSVTAKMKVADFGCGIGLMSPLLMTFGNDVTMYDIWSLNNEHQRCQAEWQAKSVGEAVPSASHALLECGLGALPKKSFGQYDAAFCISVMEHIKDMETALLDLCQSVRSGGLVFLTSDFGPSAKDDYPYAWCRPNGMFCEVTYQRLLKIAAKVGCKPFGGQPQWLWLPENEMVNGYGFASLALVKQ